MDSPMLSLQNKPLVATISLKSFTIKVFYHMVIKYKYICMWLLCWQIGLLWCKFHHNYIRKMDAVSFGTAKPQGKEGSWVACESLESCAQVVRKLRSSCTWVALKLPVSCTRVTCELHACHSQVTCKLLAFNSHFTCTLVELTYSCKFVIITIILSVLQVEPPVHIN